MTSLYVWVLVARFYMGVVLLVLEKGVWACSTLYICCN